MSTAATWLLAGAAGVGVVAVSWWLVPWLLWFRRDPDRYPPAEMFLAWTVDQQHAYLRHPGNRPRCVCGRYCIHYGVVIGRDEVRHDGYVCQPLTEVIP